MEAVSPAMVPLQLTSPKQQVGGNNTTAIGALSPSGNYPMSAYLAGNDIC